MKLPRSSLIALLLVAGLFSPLAAHAKVPLVFNTGEELFEVAPLPADLADEFPSDFSLGYRCNRFGVLWADVWTWNCTLSAVAVDQDSYGDLPDDTRKTLEEKYSMSDAKRGFWNHYGAATLGGLFTLLLLGVIRSKHR
ncbi:hypothetical protein [Dyella sp. C11]|uniref:hypothetical protein n=1 Tax=Dyella sp. C11 TaxID=2126991 RepID=UPI001300583F|nr:hypothetical protein [Dyella sp. C11]